MERSRAGAVELARAAGDAQTGYRRKREVGASFPITGFDHSGTKSSPRASVELKDEVFEPHLPLRHRPDNFVEVVVSSLANTIVEICCQVQSAASSLPPRAATVQFDARRQKYASGPCLQKIGRPAPSLLLDLNKPPSIVSLEENARLRRGAPLPAGG